MSAGTAMAALVDPTHLDGASNGGKSCEANFPGTTEIFVDKGASGTYSGITVVKPSETPGAPAASFDFSSATRLIVGVVVKDGVDGANVYDFRSQPGGGVLADDLLTTPGPEFEGSYKGISHVNFCTIPFVPTLDPLDVAKTAAGTYDRTVEWKLEKTVDDESHSGNAGENAGTSKWHVVATKVETYGNYQVSGTITISNSNDVDVPFSLSDVLDDGAVASIDCPGPGTDTGVAPANGSVDCPYTASPIDPEVALPAMNHVAVVPDDPNIGGDEADVGFSYTEATVIGDDSVTLDDDHTGDHEVISDTTEITTPEDFPCPDDATLYEDGTYEYDVLNTVTLTGEHTDLSEDANVHVVCTLDKLGVEKTATGSFDHTITWTLEKSVDPEHHVGVPGDTFSSDWTIVVTKTEKDSNFAVSGSVTITNSAAIDQAFTVSDVLDTGDSIALDCGGATVVPAGDQVICTYDASVADASATLNTATVSAPGNDDVTATADVSFSGTTIGDEETTLTDPHLDIDKPESGDDTVVQAEAFECPTDASLYVNGVYTFVVPNTAYLDGYNTHLSDSAEVDVTCNLRKISGGHTIGYYFNSPAGQQLTLNNRGYLAGAYPNVMSGVDLSSTNKIKQFGQKANCSGDCKTLLQAQFIATALQVKLDTTAPFYGDQCVAVPTYVDTVDGNQNGVAQIDDLLKGIEAKFPTLSTAQRIQLQVLLNGINNDLLFNLC
jgi:hypothetical protein